MEDKRCLTCPAWDMWENICMNPKSEYFKEHRSPEGICEKWREDNEPTGKGTD